MTVGCVQAQTAAQITIQLGSSNPWELANLQIQADPAFCQGKTETPAYYVVGHRHAYTDGVGDVEEPPIHLPKLPNLDKLMVVQISDGQAWLFKTFPVPAPTKNGMTVTLQKLKVIRESAGFDPDITLFTPIYPGRKDDQIGHTIYTTLDPTPPKTTAALKLMLQKWKDPINDLSQSPRGFPWWHLFTQPTRVSFESTLTHAGTKPSIPLTTTPQAQGKSRLTQNNPEPGKPKSVFVPKNYTDSLYDDSDDEQPPMSPEEAPLPKVEQSERLLRTFKGNSPNNQHIERLNTAREQDRLNSQERLVNQANPLLARLDLMRIQMGDNLIGLLPARRAGAESIMYPGYYQKRDQPPLLVAIKQSFITGATVPTSSTVPLIDYFENQFRHPHLMQVYDWQRYKHYLLSIEPLMSALRIEHPWDDQSIRDFAKQMLDLLAALHASHYVHRDFKPDNIVVKKLANGKKHYVLTDLGTLQKLPTTPDYHSEPHKGRCEKLVGTIAYMAPEQIAAYLLKKRVKNITLDLKEINVDAITPFSADLFGLASSLLTLFFGEPPAGALEKMIQEEGTSDHLLGRLANMLSGLTIHASSDAVTFPEIFASFQIALVPELTRQPGSWLLNLVQEILATYSTADSRTASQLFMKHFSDYRAPPLGAIFSLSALSRLSPQKKSTAVQPVSGTTPGKQSHSALLRGDSQNREK